MITAILLGIAMVALAIFIVFAYPKWEAEAKRDGVVSHDYIENNEEDEEDE